MSADAVYAYHLLKAALERFERKPIELEAEELTIAKALADATHFMEQRILSTEEAKEAAVGEPAVDAARDALAERYDDAAAFQEDLARSGLTEAVLRAALRRQLEVEATLERVAASAPSPSEAEIAAFYESRPEKFEAPERRRLRHILITVNPDFPENTRPAARARLNTIAKRLSAQPERFAEEAQTHSECPSAVEGGAIGTLARAQMMPALGEAAFALRVGEISAPVETEAGFHLALCEEVVPARRIPLDEARTQIAEALTAALQNKLKRAWIKRIAGKPATAPQAVEPTPDSPARAQEAQP